MVRKLIYLLMIVLITLCPLIGITGQKPDKEFQIIIKNWEYIPNELIVAKGDLVKIEIKNLDRFAHGFSGYGLDVKIKAGKKATIEFLADVAGEFDFRCSVPCGKGKHEKMICYFLVEDKK